MSAPLQGIADDKATAKAQFISGMGYLEKNDFPSALSAFEASYTRYPAPATLLNIGLCQKELFLHVDSISTLQKYLNQEKKISPERRAEIEGHIQEMLPMTAKLRIHGSPAEATVYVDGKKRAALSSEHAILLNPGRRLVEVRMPGYSPFRTDVVATNAKEIALQVILDESETILRVDCDDDNAAVSLDGQIIGGCPFEGGVSPGLHTIVVDSPEKKVFTKKIDVVRAGFTSIVVNLGVIESSAEVIKRDAASVASSSKTRKSLSRQKLKKKSDNRNRDRYHPLAVFGIALAGAGVAAGAVGTLFTIKYTNDFAKTDNARRRYNDETPPSGYTKTDRENDFETYNEYLDKLPADRVGMTAGFIGAGVLISAGIILAVVRSKRSETEKKIAAYPAFNGLSVFF